MTEPQHWMSILQTLTIDEVIHVVTARCFSASASASASAIKFIIVRCIALAGMVASQSDVEVRPVMLTSGVAKTTVGRIQIIAGTGIVYHSPATELITRNGCETFGLQFSDLHGALVAG